jgi:hypothetical protein
MAEEEPQFYRQFFRSRLENGQEIVREVVSPSLLDAEQARAAEAQAGRSFQGFVAPGDMPGLGAQPQAPPPPPPPSAPGLAAQAGQLFFPERTFMSEVPSIIGGTAGAVAGGLTGPFAPVAAPAAAAIGAGAGEMGQVGLERVMGWPPAEPGTPWERATRAAARGGVTEVATLPLRALPYVVRGARPVLGAAEELAPVLRQNLPEGTALLERGIAGIAPEAAQQPTLLRAWWQDVAPHGKEAVTAAWDALGPAGQAQLAGGQREAMQTVVNTLRAAGESIPAGEWGRLIGRGGGLGGLATYLGYPELGTALAVVPQAMSLARTTAPRLAAPMLLSPTASQFLAQLPQAARVAGPWPMRVAQAGSQAVSPLVWPEPPVVASPY